MAAGVALVAFLVIASCGSESRSDSTDSTPAPTSAPATTSANPDPTTTPTPEPPTSPAVTSGEVIYDPTALGQLGDCFNEGSDALVAVSCDEPHDYQIVLADGVYSAPDGADYPSEDEWLDWDTANCIPALAHAVQ